MVADRKGRQHQGGVTFITGAYSPFELDRCGFIDVRHAPILPVNSIAAQSLPD